LNTLRMTWVIRSLRLDQLSSSCFLLVARKRPARQQELWQKR